MIGQTFSLLTVTEFLGPSPQGHLMWQCRCACGTVVSKRGSHLKNGEVKSCGCLFSSTRMGRLRHGGTSERAHSPEYRSWINMRQRCRNPKNNRYQYYGAIGVVVCDQWVDSFETFLTDMGPKPTPSHSIDRYPNPAGNYEPTNCRWATATEQRHNRRN